jgi:cell division protease FtsH
MQENNHSVNVDHGVPPPVPKVAPPPLPAPGAGGKPTSKFKLILYLLFGFVFITLIGLYFINDHSNSKEISWTEFQELAKQDVFEEILVFNKKNVLEATVRGDKRHIVFRNPDEAALGMPIVVNIPSSSKVDDFYRENYIQTKVLYREGDDSFLHVILSMWPVIFLFLIILYVLTWKL